MKMKLISGMALCLTLLNCFGQESNNGKTLYADSFLNQKAPKFFVEQWITEQPTMKGKFILIDFWDTYCAPCLKAIPETNKLAAEFKQNLVVIGVAERSTVEQIKMLGDQMKYYTALDTKGTMRKALGVKGIPHAILVDPKGIVRWEGFPQLEGHELTPEIVKHLLEKYK